MSVGSFGRLYNPTERVVLVEYGGSKFFIDCVPQNLTDDKVQAQWRQGRRKLRIWYPNNKRFHYKLLSRSVRSANLSDYRFSPLD